MRAAPALTSEARVPDVHMMAESMPLALPWVHFGSWHIEGSLKEVRHKVRHTASFPIGAFFNTLKHHPRQRDRHPLGGGALVLVVGHSVGASLCRNVYPVGRMPVLLVDGHNKKPQGRFPQGH